MADKEQAPALDHLSSEKIVHLRLTKLRRRKIIQACGCVSAFFLILAMVIIILIFTVFRIKDPRIKLNSFTFTKLELVNGTIPKPGVNVSLIADMSVKNPNAASFTYGNTTTLLYYHGALMGEARGPPARSRPRRTARMNFTVDIIADRLMAAVPSLPADLGSGLLVVGSYSRIGGRANIWNIFKKHVIVTMNCTTKLNISSQQFIDQKCKRKVEY